MGNTGKKQHICMKWNINNNQTPRSWCFAANATTMPIITSTICDITWANIAIAPQAMKADAILQWPIKTHMTFPPMNKNIETGGNATACQKKTQHSWMWKQLSSKIKQNGTWATKHTEHVALLKMRQQCPSPHQQFVISHWRTLQLPHKRWKFMRFTNAR